MTSDSAMGIVWRFAGIAGLQAQAFFFRIFENFLFTLVEEHTVQHKLGSVNCTLRQSLYCTLGTQPAQSVQAVHCTG